MQCSFVWIVNFQKKNLFFPFSNLFLVLPSNTMLQHLIIQFPLYYMSCDCLQEVQNKRNFQPSSSKSGRGHLQEVFTYKRFHIQWFDPTTFSIFGKLLAEERGLSLRGGGSQRFDYANSLNLKLQVDRDNHKHALL